MSFNSYLFILLFLPLFLFVINKVTGENNIKARYYVILLFSLVFYGMNGLYHLAVILFLSVLTYYLTIKGKVKTSVVTSILVLISYKYFRNIIVPNSFIDLFVFPVALSYVSFSQISFSIEYSKSRIENVSFIEYLVFIFYFPKVIQGPVTDPVLFINELRESNNNTKITDGFILFMIGLCKKVLLADVFGGAVSYGFSHIDSLNTTSLLVTMLSLTIQIYFDFSGYSDMALGISKMIGIELPINFNSPYKAKNISDFWKRWHMSLTSFLTKYVYIPLGGNRKGLVRTYINVMIVFAVSGLWHGNGWNYLLWGLLNGLAMVIYRAFSKYIDKIPNFISIILTFVFVNISWVLFRTNSVNEFVLFMNGLLKLNIGSISSKLVQLFYITSINTQIDSILHANFWIYVYFAIALIIIFLFENSNSIVEKIKTNKYYYALLLLMFIYSILELSKVTVFMYQFY